MPSDEDLDNLLDDALENFVEHEKEEEEREERKKQEKIERETRKGPDGDLTDILEGVLKQFSPEDAGDEKMQELLQQGISLLKDEGSGNEQDLLNTCQKLLETITSELSPGEGEDPMTAGLLSRLKESLGSLDDVMKGMGTEGAAADGGNPDQALGNLEGIMQELLEGKGDRKEGAADDKALHSVLEELLKDRAGGAAADPQMENLMKQLCEVPGIGEQDQKSLEAMLSSMLNDKGSADLAEYLAKNPKDIKDEDLQKILAGGLGEGGEEHMKKMMEMLGGKEEIDNLMKMLEGLAASAEEKKEEPVPPAHDRPLPDPPSK